MRRSANLTIPVGLITLYYAVGIAAYFLLVYAFPGVRDYLPVGGISALLASDADSFEAVQSATSGGLLARYDGFTLAIAIVGTAVLMIPVSWVYFITSRGKEIDQSFVQTIVVLPLVVTGIAMIVQNSLALAFSLAGIVAAVRFRFTLDKPSHALYIFAAIAVGLGSGIGALGVATVISITFVYANLIFWKLDYGKTLSGPFLSLLTRRTRDTDEY